MSTIISSNNDSRPVSYQPLVDSVPDDTTVADYLDQHEDQNLKDLYTNLVFEIRRAVRSKTALLVLRRHQRFPLEKSLFQEIEKKCTEFFGASLGDEMFNLLLRDTRDMLKEQGLCLVDDTTGTGDIQYSVDRLKEREDNSPLRVKMRKAVSDASLPTSFVSAHRVMAPAPKNAEVAKDNAPEAANVSEAQPAEGTETTADFSINVG